jgi:predicted nucleic acid-binding protein
MAEVVLDANVIVGWLDEQDTQNERATRFIRGLRAQGHSILVLDLIAAEALSVICRRATERKVKATDTGKVIAAILEWQKLGVMAFISHDIEAHFEQILDVVAASSGALNFNDALLVVLQREKSIGEVATFDAKLASVSDFRALS